MRRRFANNHKTLDYSKYMTIEVLEDGYTAYFTRDVEYNLNGHKWVRLKAGLFSPILKKGDLLSLRCSLMPGERFGYFYGNYKAINLRGNILSLIFKDDINLDISSYPYVFYNAFNSRYGNNIVSVEKNFLPATTLAQSCYDHMFYGCTSLITAPDLPATTLAQSCYDRMFGGTNVLPDCSNIDFTSNTVVSSGGLSGLFGGTKVTDNDLYDILPINPVTGKYWLPATTLASNCYSNMFDDCTSLTTAPELPAITLASGCYKYMFYGCSKLNYIKMRATNISASSCLTGWVVGVSSTGTFVKHPAMTSLPTGTSGIPEGWTVKKA